MNMNRRTFLTASLVIAAGALAACTGDPAALPVRVNIARAAELRDAGAFVLDVREPFEWVEGHIPGSTLIPLAELPARVAEVPKDKPILVVCRSGNRSQSGRDILLQAGFQNVTSMDGGVVQWGASGREIVVGE
jgi:rhodanese-related sulfurtransferase